ncbi:hypothetical protein [Myroides odoratimimus]|uniref:hypothetical protein n=1 Tax=Myroides odoratimimus TaxID=76832 RepID=UPI002576D7FE|nr:hypothetical protein [Myroides odoratimimus]MDM1060115.1 hypothetical protein [Myroides odoratimimus]MDM1537515.1 hypothetical protein [Myroides odoratimimus]MDM1677068.1 hypothetical protein [Myroides odoratimimus]
MLAIFSLIVTIVLGLPSVIHFFRQKKTKLIYLENKQINIQDDLLKNFDDLLIKYKDQEIDSNLIFIKGYIICDGSNDITSNGNFISIYSPENTKWLDFKIISESKEFLVSSNFLQNEAKISFDLFKSEENFEFEGIVERAINSKEKNITLSFFHRIPNLSKITAIKSHLLRDLFYPFIMATVSFLFGLFLFSTEFKITPYHLSVYDFSTNKEITDFNKSQAIKTDNIIEELKHETNGIFLMFKPSKNYKVNYKNYELILKKDTIIEESIVYFKKDISISSIIIVTVSIFFLLFSVFVYLSYFYFLSQRKYLKYVT